MMERPENKEFHMVTWREAYYAQTLPYKDILPKRSIVGLIIEENDEWVHIGYDMYEKGNGEKGVSKGHIIPRKMIVEKKAYIERNG